MLNRNKKLLAIVLATILVFSLAACSNSSSGGASTGNNSTNSNNSTASGDTYKIGAYLPLSGGNAAYGIEARNTIDMMVKMINAEGGFNGQTVEFIPYDSQSSPEEAVKVVNKLIEVDKINACIGSILSSEILATGKTLNDAGIITYGLGTSPSWMAEDWPYLFRATMNSGFAMGLEADMLVKLGMTRVATFKGLDDSSLATQASFKEECELRGIEIVADESHDSGDTDFSAQIANLMAADPECIWFATMGEVTPVFVKQLRQYGFTGIIMDKEAFSVAMIEIAGKAASTHIMFANPYVTYNSVDECDIPIMREFLELYIAEYGVCPATECGYRAWDSILALWEAAKIAGSNDPEAMREAAHKVNVPALGGTLDFTNGDREGYREFNTFMMVDGESRMFDEWVANDYEAYKEANAN